MYNKNKIFTVAVTYEKKIIVACFVDTKYMDVEINTFSSLLCKKTCCCLFPLPCLKCSSIACRRVFNKTKLPFTIKLRVFCSSRVFAKCRLRQIGCLSCSLSPNSSWGTRYIDGVLLIIAFPKCIGECVKISSFNVEATWCLNDGEMRVFLQDGFANLDVLATFVFHNLVFLVRSYF